MTYGEMGLQFLSVFIGAFAGGAVYEYLKLRRSRRGVPGVKPLGPPPRMPPPQRR